MGTESSSAYGLLQGLLPPPSAPVAPLERWLPCSGTLPALRLAGLRSVGQVIFINNPLSGGLVFLALLLASPWLALLAMLGTAAAQLTSHVLQADGPLRQQGIHGFNGALVGCAMAVLGEGRPLGTGLAAMVLSVAGGALTTVLMECWRWAVQRWGTQRWLPPPLTLPFILVSWVLLALAGPPVDLPAAGPAVLAPASAGPLALLWGVSASFGQVFLCADPRSGGLVLLAVALASPLAALLGGLGAMVAMVKRWCWVLNQPR